MCTEKLLNKKASEYKCKSWFQLQHEVVAENTVMQLFTK
jgi:hypothetical protein